MMSCETWSFIYPFILDDTTGTCISDGLRSCNSAPPILSGSVRARVLARVQQAREKLYNFAGERRGISPGNAVGGIHRFPLLIYLRAVAFPRVSRFFSLSLSVIQYIFFSCLFVIDSGQVFCRFSGIEKSGKYCLVLNTLC